MRHAKIVRNTLRRSFVINNGRHRIFHFCRAVLSTHSFFFVKFLLPTSHISLLFLHCTSQLVLSHLHISCSQDLNLIPSCEQILALELARSNWFELNRFSSVVAPYSKTHPPLPVKLAQLNRINPTISYQLPNPLESSALIGDPIKPNERPYELSSHVLLRHARGSGGPF
jgi:hypothetical protein